jgi:Ca2+-binding EF-hand superfamily protein
MKSLLLSAVALAAAAGIAPALAQTAPAGGQQPMQMKTITRAEVTQRVQERFAKLDANHDGFITRDEAQAAAQIMHARMEQRMEKRGDSFFDRLDANHDGVVTKAEVDAAFAARAAKNSGHAAPGWDRFAARFDTNHDGVISRAEFDAARAQHGQAMAENGEHPGGMRHMAGFSGRMFDMADLNHDGKVSLQEATQAALQHFDAADANHDGVLTPDEMRAAHQRNHPKS